MKEKEVHIGELFLPQRKEENGWRSMGFPCTELSKAVERCDKIVDSGFEARVVRRRASVVWGR